MKKLIFILALILSVHTAYPQSYNNKGGYSSKSGFDASKLNFGGNLNLQFGDYTAIGISPQVGYDFSKYFTAGAGLGYSYFREKEYDYKWSRHYLSFDVFGRFYPVEYIVLSIQPEISRVWETVDYRSESQVKTNKFVPSFLVGGGVRFMGMIAMIQYDVVQNDYSPYGNNLFYSIGYSFNF
ncbi:MAG: hypothetical protein LBN74_04510 [Prevotella sp.]|jgi:hypothetical protein|nr:hypothetical protein [Prevotella sp.]